MKKLRVGLAGLGTVGAKVADRLLAGDVAGVELAAVSARDASRQREVGEVGAGSVVDLSKCRFASPAQQLICDDIDIVVELIGGSDGVAYDLVCGALAAGKAVVTANKALLAAHGDKLSALSNATLANTTLERPPILAYEAAVAGGIPIIKVLREGLAGNQVQRICGILNGTCNYVLSQMAAGGLDFDSALQAAQAKGFAESDPALDISGIDAAQKLAILAALAFDVRPDVAAFSVAGISKIEARDIIYAAQFDKIIRLIALAEKPIEKSEGVYMQVAPMLVNRYTPLAEVHDELNGLLINSDPLGALFLQGAGAGGGATASAVLADIADIAAGYGRPAFAYACESMTTPMAQLAAARSYYVRLELADKRGSMAAATQILAENGVSIEEVVQRSSNTGDSHLPVVFITHKIAESALNNALAALQDKAAFCQRILALPILDR